MKILYRYKIPRLKRIEENLSMLLYHFFPGDDCSMNPLTHLMLELHGMYCRVLERVDMDAAGHRLKVVQQTRNLQNRTIRN